MQDLKALASILHRIPMNLSAHPCNWKGTIQVLIKIIAIYLECFSICLDRLRYYVQMNRLLRV